MKTRALILVTSLMVCGFSVAGVTWQSRRLDSLRDEGRRLRQQLDDLREDKNPSAATAATTRPAVTSPSAELLRLRNQVSQLARRERELAGVQIENQRLQTQTAAARTNKMQLPASYIRKSEARNLGYATPEATIETYLWAVRNRDLDAMLACFTPQAAIEIKLHFERGGGEKLFENSDMPGALPGINVLDRIQKSDDVLEYKVEMVPGSGTSEPMPFRRINGEWKFGPPR